jgi:hypothetical protein
LNTLGQFDSQIILELRGAISGNEWPPVKVELGNEVRFLFLLVARYDHQPIPCNKTLLKDVSLCINSAGNINTVSYTVLCKLVVHVRS